MIRSRGILLLALLLAGTWVAGLGEVRPSVSVETAWRQMSSYLFAEAEAGFAAAEEEVGAEAALGRALARLNSGANTSARLGQVEQSLVALSREAGDLGALATYQLGRLREVHRLPSDRAGAREAFEKLQVAHPDSPLVQWALVREALQTLYQAPPAAVSARFAEAAELSAVLTDPVARRNLHLQLAQAADRFKLGPTIASDHYRAADALGVRQAAMQGLVWQRLGELAELGNRPEEAAAYFRKFSQAFPRDERTPTARARIAEAEAQK